MFHNSYQPSYYHNPNLRSYHNPLFYCYQPTAYDLNALARERDARRAQYLPHEDVIDSDEEALFSPLGQRERVYLDARRRQDALERREEEARKEQLSSTPRHQQSRSTSSSTEQHTPPHKQSPSQTSQRHSIPIHVRGSPRRETSMHEKPNPSPKSQSPSKPAVEYTQTHHDAAGKIQERYRQHRALRLINEVASQFEQERRNFVFPDAIDFVDPEQPGGVVTVPVPKEEAVEEGGNEDVEIALDNSGATAAEPDTAVDIQVPALEDVEAGWTTDLAASDEDEVGGSAPSSASTTSTDADMEMTPSETSDSHPNEQLIAPKLAYTKRNYPLHAFMDQLDVLLIKLDSIESFGSRKVRESRKGVARTVEKEAERVEKVRKDAWKRFSETRQAAWVFVLPTTTQPDDHGDHIRVA